MLMTDLIARLEAAPEGSRILDARIAVTACIDMPTPMGDASPYLKMPHKLDECEPGTYWLVQRSGMSLLTAPHYTTSLDAALTLVPEGWRGKLLIGDWSDGQRPEQDRAALWNNDDGARESVFGVGSSAATPALALCIASLRAREKSDG